MRFRLVENLLLEYKTKTNPFSGVLGNDEFQEVFKKISKGTSMSKKRYQEMLQQLMDKYFPNANAENVKAVIHSIIRNNAYNINTAPLWEWMLNAPKISEAETKIDKLDTLTGKNVYDFNQPWFKNINLWKKSADDFVYVVNVFTMFQSPDKLKRVFNDKFIKDNAKALSLSHLFAGVKIDPNTGLPSQEIPEAKYETQKIKDTDKIKYVIDVLDKLADSQGGKNEEDDEDEEDEKDKDNSSKSNKKSSGEHYKDVADRFTKLKNVLNNLKSPPTGNLRKQQYINELNDRYIEGNGRDRQRGIYSYKDLIKFSKFNDSTLNGDLESAYKDVSSKLNQGEVDLKPILSAIDKAIKFAQNKV
jgi:transcription elongation factor Elf1